MSSLTRYYETQNASYCPHHSKHLGPPQATFALPGATSPLTLEMELDRLCDLIRASFLLFVLLEGTASSEILRALILERTGSGARNWRPQASA